MCPKSVAICLGLGRCAACRTLSSTLLLGCSKVVLSLKSSLSLLFFENSVESPLTEGSGTGRHDELDPSEGSTWDLKNTGFDLVERTLITKSVIEGRSVFFRIQQTLVLIAASILSACINLLYNCAASRFFLREKFAKLDF